MPCVNNEPSCTCVVHCHPWKAHWTDCTIYLQHKFVVTESCIGSVLRKYAMVESAEVGDRLAVEAGVFQCWHSGDTTFICS